LTLVNVIRNYSDVFNQNRYTRDGFNAEVFELAHVLLWSRISQETYNQLINCFTTNTVSSTVDQLNARDKDGKMTDQWVSGLVDTVVTSVYYSYKVVVKGQNRSEYSEQWLMRLIKSAIQGTTEFFNEQGLNPCPPSWFKEVQKKLVDKDLIERAIKEVHASKGTRGMDLNAIYSKYTPNMQENFITFIRVAFAVNLHFCIVKNQKRGKPTLLQISTDFPTECIGNIRIFHLVDDMESKVTTCIKEWYTKIAEGTCTLDDQIVRVTRHFLEAKRYQLYWVSKKENKKTDNQEDDDLISKLMKNLLSLKQTNYPSYLQHKIESHCFDDESEAEAESLLKLFQELETSHEDGNEESGVEDGGDGEKEDIAPYTCEYLQF